MTKRLRIDGRPKQTVFVVNWLRPKPGKQEFSLDIDENWDLVRGFLSPPGTGRSIFADDLTITLMEKPDDLADAIEMAKSMCGDGLSETKTDRNRAAGDYLKRQVKRQDNRRHGGWGYGRD